MAPKKKQKVATKIGPVARDTTQTSMSVVDSARAESGEIRKPRSTPNTVKSIVRHALSDSSLRECSLETIDGRTYEGQTLRQRLEIAKQQELDNPKTVSFGRKYYETLILGLTETEFKCSAQVFLRQKASKGGDQLQLMLAIARMWHRTSARSKWAGQPGLFMHLGPAIDALIISLMWQTVKRKKPSKISALKGVMLKVLQNQSCNNATMSELFDIYGDILYMIMSPESVKGVLTAPEGTSVMELEKHVYELVSSSSAGRKLFGLTWKKVIAGKVDELLLLLAGRMMGKKHIK
eukprot:2587965-Amphidinium_carterae.2